MMGLVHGVEVAAYQQKRQFLDDGGIAYRPVICSSHARTESPNKEPSKAASGCRLWLFFFCLLRSDGLIEEFHTVTPKKNVFSTQATIEAVAV